MLTVSAITNARDYRSSRPTVLVSQIVAGRLFQVRGPATSKARSHILVLVLGTKSLSPEESFINGQVMPIPCLDITDLLPNICTCDDERAVTCAAPNAAETKTFVTKFTDNCNVNNQVPPNRRRRDADNAAEEASRKEDMMIITADDIPQPTFDYKHGVDFIDRWPTASGITKAQAETEWKARLSMRCAKIGWF